MSGRSILLTRPYADSEAVAAMLATRGWNSVIEPLLRIEYAAPDLPDLSVFDGLAFTSRYGVEGFARLTGNRRLPVFAVGAATAAAARRVGFADIATGPGNAAQLAAGFGARRLLHPCGRNVRGLPAEPLAVYHAVASTALSGATLDRLRSDGIKAAMFFSPRTARIFGCLATGPERSALQDVWALCLSRAVLESADGLPWRGLRMAALPDLPAMLALADALTRDTY